MGNQPGKLTLHLFFVKPQAGKGDVPPEVAARQACTGSSSGLLEQVIAEALFGPVGPKAHWEQWVKDIDALFDGFGYGPLESLKGNFQGRGPLEGIL